jgi:hypothetical protein
MTIGSERFDTPHLRHTWQVGRSASHQRKDDEHEAREDAGRVDLNGTAV